ncbi:zinc finger MYM-type protein 1-like [Zingiber officinale]|uniref:zinc finger MYM-type protein 1-like n=1 Tax=Zingiber officinale TaxID=94328 RepID=UPI001C4AD5FF|nr:zinc finger MYM-type protein 1-like [Zingiber officinale]
MFFFCRQFVNCNFSLFAIANLDSASAVGDSTLRRFVLSSYVRRSTAHQSDTRRSVAHCSARRVLNVDSVVCRSIVAPPTSLPAARGPAAPARLSAATSPIHCSRSTADSVHFVRDQKVIIWLFQQVQIMERFFKPKRFREGSSNDPNINEVVEIQSHVELDLNDIVSDPGLRKSIEEFDISIRDQVRREYLTRGPCKPIGHMYPKRSFGGRYKEDAFVKNGFINRKNALERFNLHNGAVDSCHNHARVQVESFQDQRHSVSNILRAHGRDIEVSYRIRLTAMLDVTRFLLKQGLSFRGHDESSNSLNRGNFLDGNNQMISPAIQKDLTRACASEITLSIIEDIGNNVFSLMVDESRDISVKEQMRVVLRYVNKRGQVIERFLAIVHVSDTSSRSLKDAIDALFAKHGLSLSRLRGQGYDGASNMRGEFNGLKSLILQENPYASYIHCFSHQLQLVIIAVAKSNLNASDFFNYVTMIVNTTGASCKRRDQLRQIEHDRIVVMLEGGDISTGSGKNQETNLVRPGDTRWGSHYLRLGRLLSMWPSVIQVLENICDDSSSFDSRGVAKSLIQKMENYEFVFMLHLMKMILGMTNELSLVLQQKDQNIVQAISLIESVKDQFQIFREDGWHTIIDKVNTFCELNEIPVPEMKDNCMIGGRSRRRRQVITNLHYYRVEIFYQVVDSVIQEMNTHFSEVGTELLSCIACLHPRNSFSEFNVQKLVRLCDLYPEDFSTNDCIVIEQQLQNFIHNIRQDPNFFGIEDLGSFAQKIVETQKNQAYPLVYRLIEMTLVLPVATASVERVFSAMKTIKTDLRNRMGDEWMNCLVVYIEKDIFSTIENEQILQRFQKMKSRRMQLPPLSYPTIT